MTKEQKIKIATGMAISIFVGTVILAFILIKNRKNKSLSTRIASQAKEDLEYWNNLKETDLLGATKISEYWNFLNYNYTADQLMKSAFQSDKPWSAVYISYFLYKLGAGDSFKYSPRHSDYFCQALKDKEANDKNAMFYGYKPDEKPIKIGDIVGFCRQSNATWDNICKGIATHGDIVYKLIKTSNGYDAYLIGGNISNTVSSKIIKLDKSKKILNPEKYLIHLSNNKT